MARRLLIVLLVVMWSWLGNGEARAQVSARMLRQPDVSDREITFVYGGDVWVVPREGGTASRLSSPPGEELFPRFSPDGSLIAFTGNYDGNEDVYVIDREGGLPVRLTYHPMPDRLSDWYPDGQGLLIAASRESGKQRFNQFFRVNRQGGLPEKLPLPYGEFGSISADGKWLAYTPRTRDFRTWKRYRGGMNPDIWLFNLDTYDARNITNSPANDSTPMWSGQTLYFLSDRGPEARANIWAYDLDKENFRQVTRFEKFDIHFPSIGPKEIVFEAGGRLYLLELDGEKSHEVHVDVVTDERTVRPRVESVARLIESASLSPTGKRALFEARGDVFSVPAEHGVILNLTRDSGVAERSPAWSPDGKTVAFWSDRSGEYELTIRNADGTGEERKLTSFGPGFRYSLFWSPDSRKLAFVDNAMRIQLFDRDSEAVTEIDRGKYLTHGPLSNFQPSWSSDSRWLAYELDTENRSHAIWVYDVENSSKQQLTSGYYDDTSPVFDPQGKYLYFLTNRTFDPAYSDFDNSWAYVNATQLAAVTLTRTEESPLAPRNDVEGVDTDSKDQEQGGEVESGESDESVQDPASVSGEDKDKEEAAEKRVELDPEGFERRVVILPPKAGNYRSLQAAEGKVIYLRLPRTEALEDAKRDLVFYDLKEREEKSILSGVDGYSLSFDGKRLLVLQGEAWGIIDVAPGQELKKKLATGDLEMTVDPRLEWHQMFSDAWRLERDYFYDPNMHGVDWAAMRQQYGPLVDDCVTRSDVNFVIGELIAELNSSHTYRGGGDEERAERRGVGLLGIDWSLENGAYRVKRIIRGAPWDTEVRSPLDEPAVEIGEGDYILAVNGMDLDTSKDPWAGFQGLEDQTVQLTVNSTPELEGSRQVLVKTLSDETRLRNLAWIEESRKRVEEASGGEVGYIYVPSTGIDGQTELVRQFYAQFKRKGLIIDERFNNGGQIPDRFIELLNRKPLSFWAVRSGKDWQTPPVAHFGPKVMMINGWSGSGGDAFPFYFREAGLGPLIGMPTWGGLIGISGVPGLVDGGGVTVPTFRMYDPEGRWFAEGVGVEPDIRVEENPTEMARGRDPQLERAIQEAMRLIEASPPLEPGRPRYQDRSQ